MRLLFKFVRLSCLKRSLLLKAALLLFLAEAGLHLIPFRFFKSLFSGSPRRSGKGVVPDRSLYLNIGWAVSAAAGRLPGTHRCLPQALAAQMLLRWYGAPSRIRIGVAKDSFDRFQAHAWLESGGKIVVGGQGVKQYVPLAVLGETGG